MTDKCLKWLTDNSAVEAVNVAAGRGKIFDLGLNLEIQAFVYDSVAVAMCVRVDSAVRALIERARPERIA